MEKKILVAYFSASGITKEYAVTLALKLGADLYEIEPAQPYTEADLDWNDRNSRCVKEWKDKSCRPEIRTSVPDKRSFRFPPPAAVSGEVPVPICTNTLLQPQYGNVER